MELCMNWFLLPHPGILRSPPTWPFVCDEIFGLIRFYIVFIFHWRPLLLASMLLRTQSVPTLVLPLHTRKYIFQKIIKQFETIIIIFSYHLRIWTNWYCCVSTNFGFQFNSIQNPMTLLYSLKNENKWWVCITCVNNEFEHWVWTISVNNECEQLVWTMSVKNVSEQWVWTMSVNNECEQLVWTMSVNNVSEQWVWTISVNNECEQLVWTISVNNECEQWAWTICVNNECEQWIWTLNVQSAVS